MSSTVYRGRFRQSSCWAAGRLHLPANAYAPGLLGLLDRRRCVGPRPIGRNFAVWSNDAGRRSVQPSQCDQHDDAKRNFKPMVLPRRRGRRAGVDFADHAGSAMDIADRLAALFLDRVFHGL